MALIGVLLAALAVGLLLYMLLATLSRPDNFPPGPPPMPIWGNYVQLLLLNYKYPYKVLDLLTRFYKTKVIGFYFGNDPAVAACDYNSVKEALNNPHLQGRVVNISIKHRMFEKDLGIFFTDGPQWLEQKRFSLRYMRDYGFGRRFDRLEGDMEAELRDLVDLIRGGREDKVVVRPSSGEKSARSVLLPEVLYPGFINGLLPVFAGSRLPRSADETTRFLGRAALEFQKSSDTTGGFLSLHPWLARVAPWFSGYQGHTQGSAKMRRFLEQLIEEHKKTFSEDDMRDFIDTYLREITEQEKTGEPTAFSTEQLSLILLDFFFPAASALSATMTWALMYMVNHPEVAKRVQEELDSVVGRGRFPTLNDRPNLPYCEATIREVMRIRTLTPISVPHKAMEDTTLQGYSVPKGTIVITCLHSMHMDKDFWGDPDTFRPERFLDSDGKLSKKDFTLPFGAGKRLCAGETFARQNLFLTFTTLMQNFTVKADGVPSLDNKIPGVIETAPLFWAQFEAR